MREARRQRPVLLEAKSVLPHRLPVVPRSNGGSRRQGAIAKTGNAHARRVLVEGAWSYRHPACVSRQIRLRQDALPEEIRDIAWKPQLRLCARCRRMLARDKHRNQVITAIARELIAFMWAIAKKLPLAEAQSVAQASLARTVAMRTQGSEGGAATVRGVTLVPVWRPQRPSIKVRG